MAIKFGRPIEARARFAPVENPAQAQQRLDLTVRMRRNRQHEWARRMVREHRLSTDDLIWPLFVMDGRERARRRCRRCRASSGCRSTNACAKPSARPN